LKKELFMTTTLYLMRHGESEGNLRRAFLGHTDLPLTERGRAQARKTAAFLSEKKPDVIYASDLLRAYNTGKAVADVLSLPVYADARLREISAGKWEGETFDKLPKKYPADFSLWLTDIGNSRPTEGESVRQLGQRILSAVTDIAEKNDGKTLVIATHATPIRVLQCMLGGHSFDEMQNIPWVSNCSVTEICYDDGNWKLIKIGYDEHLAGMRSSLPANV
jgi:broad specificity phosphatase PhoE